MSNLIQKRILDLVQQNHILQEEIIKLQKSLNEVRMLGPNGDVVNVPEDDVRDAQNDGYKHAGGLGTYIRSDSTRDYGRENTLWHTANITPLIQKHGLGEHSGKFDAHGVPHSEHTEALKQHPNFGAYIRDLKTAHEMGFEVSKQKSATGKGSRWHVGAFGKINPLLRKQRGG